MKNNVILLSLALMFSTYAFSQQFQIGDKVQIKSQQFKLLDYSPSMKVHTYHYIGLLTNNYLIDRKIGEILIGIKNGIVVTIIYNLIPKKGEHEISKSTVKLIKDKWKVTLLPLPFGNYVATTGNTLLSLRIINNEITFGQARIVLYTTVKYSILMP